MVNLFQIQSRMDNETDPQTLQAMQALGRKIKQMRLNPKKPSLNGKKINGIELAIGIRLSQGSIGNYENGHRLPNLKIANQICEYLGYQPHEILPDTQELRDALYRRWEIDGLEGFFESTVDLHSKKNLHFTSEARRVNVMYSTELVPGQFSAGKLIKNLNKSIFVTPQEFSPTAFALIYTGSEMGEMLEHQQPIILDEREPKPGDLCMLRKNDGFMFCVFESESPFGMVFRLKGTQSKLTATPENSYTVYKVMAIRNASDIE